MRLIPFCFNWPWAAAGDDESVQIVSVDLTQIAFHFCTGPEWPGLELRTVLLKVG